MSQYAQAMQSATSSLIVAMGGGRQVTLRRYEEDVDPVAAKTTRGEAVETVIADVLVGAFKKGEYKGQRSEDVKLVISGEAVLSAPLDSAWDGQLDGESDAHPILIPTMSAAPDGLTTTATIVALRKGAAGAS